MMKYIMCLALALLMPLHLSAEESLFQKVSVSNTVSLDVPKHWKVRDESARKDIAASTEVLMGSATHVASLSVVSQPEPSGGIIRVSFVGNGGVTQQLFATEVRRDKASVQKDLEEGLVDEFKGMIFAFEKQGIKILNGPTIVLISIDNKIGFAIVYRRTGNNDSTFMVTQYHIPLEKNKALITLSFREQDQRLFKPIIDKVRNSIRFGS